MIAGSLIAHAASGIWAEVAHGRWTFLAFLLSSRTEADLLPPDPRAAARGGEPILLRDSNRLSKTDGVDHSRPSTTGRTSSLGRRRRLVGRHPGSRYTPATFKRSSRGSRLAWIPIVMPRTAVPIPTRTSPCGGRSSTARTRSTREIGAV